MDETDVRTRKIKIDQERMKYINFAHNEESRGKKAALARVLKEREEK